MSKPRAPSSTSSISLSTSGSPVSLVGSPVPKLQKALAMARSTAPSSGLPSLAEQVPLPEPHPDYHDMIGRLKQGGKGGKRIEEWPLIENKSTHFKSHVEWRTTQFKKRPGLRSATKTSAKLPPANPLMLVPHYDMGRTLAKVKPAEQSQSRKRQPACTSINDSLTSPANYRLSPAASEDMREVHALAAAQEQKEQALLRLKKRSQELRAVLGAKRIPNSVLPLVKATSPKDICTTNIASVQVPRTDLPFCRLPIVRYKCAEDPRGFVEVYKYEIKAITIPIDVDTSFVNISGICKALGPTKDLTRQLEAEHDLRRFCTVIREGDAQLQGIWVPYNVAWALCSFCAFSLRRALVPLFGEKFVDACLPPSEPRFGHLRLALIQNALMEDSPVRRSIALPEHAAPTHSSPRHSTLPATSKVPKLDATQGQFQEQPPRRADAFKPVRGRRRATATVAPERASGSDLSAKSNLFDPLRDDRVDNSKEKERALLSTEERQQALSEFHAMQLISSKGTTLKRKRTTADTPPRVGRPRKACSLVEQGPVTLDRVATALEQSSRVVETRFAGTHPQETRIICDQDLHAAPTSQICSSRQMPGFTSSPASRSLHTQSLPHQPQQLLGRGSHHQEDGGRRSPYPSQVAEEEWLEGPATTRALPPPPSKDPASPNVGLGISRGGQGKASPYHVTISGTRAALPPTPTRVQAQAQAQARPPGLGLAKKSLAATVNPVTPPSFCTIRQQRSSDPRLCLTDTKQAKESKSRGSEHPTPVPSIAKAEQKSNVIRPWLDEEIRKPEPASLSHVQYASSRHAEAHAGHDFAASKSYTLAMPPLGKRIGLLSPPVQRTLGAPISASGHVDLSPSLRSVGR